MTTQVLYLAGLGRSGSTLLTRLLGQIEGVCSVGEIHHLWKTGAPRAAADELCGCGETYADCGFWLDRLAAAAQGGGVDLERMRSLQEEVSRIRRIPRLESGGDAAFEAAVEEYAGFWSRLYAELREATGARVILDASKDLGPLFFLDRVEGIEVRVLHLVRDPRGVAFSWSQRKLRPEFVDREVYMNRHGVLDVALRWWYSNLLADRASRRFPHTMRLRYEDFVAEPKAALETICAFADLDGADLSFLDGRSARISRGDHSLSGNPMRFDSGALTIRADMRWHQEMSAAGRWATAALTWPLRRRYAYSWSAR